MDEFKVEDIEIPDIDNEFKVEDIEIPDIADEFKVEDIEIDEDFKIEGLIMPDMEEVKTEELKIEELLEDDVEEIKTEELIEDDVEEEIKTEELLEDDVEEEIKTEELLEDDIEEEIVAEETLKDDIEEDMSFADFGMPNTEESIIQETKMGDEEEMQNISSNYVEGDIETMSIEELKAESIQLAGRIDSLTKEIREQLMATVKERRAL